MNYYEILEVSPKASPAVIKAAYKSLIQRYHPDKNPGDAGVAERASQVVEAYRVLSDDASRAAYDRQLLAQPAPAKPAGQGGERRLRPTVTERRKGRNFWGLCLILAVIVAAGASWKSLSKPRLSPEAEFAQITLALQSKRLAPVEEQAAITRRNELVRDHPALAAQMVAERNSHRDLRLVPALVTDLAVPLKHPDATPGQVGSLLSIPVIEVEVGARDTASAIRHLNNTAGQIRQQLLTSLGAASSEALLGPDGEAYLKRLIVEAIGQASGTAGAGEEAGDGRYGVVAVSLPESFSLK